jgi:hypothetical protein
MLLHFLVSGYPEFRVGPGSLFLSSPIVPDVLLRWHCQFHRSPRRLADNRAPSFSRAGSQQYRDNVIAGDSTFIEDRYTPCDLCSNCHRKIIFGDADKIIFSVPCFYAEIFYASLLPLFIISPFLRRSPASSCAHLSSSCTGLVIEGR